MGATGARASLAIGVALALVPAAAAAQGPGLFAQRTALATYDVSGTRTLDVLRALGPLAAGSGPDATEARYLRAVAGADLHVIALASEDTALDGRLADALGVPAGGLAAELQSELGAVETGLYRRVVREERAILTEAERIAGGEVRVTGSGGRSAALFVLGVARATRSRDALAAIHTSAAAASRPGWLVGPDAGLEAPIQAALRAEAIAARAAADGDPLVVALAGALASAHASLLALELRVPPSVASEAGLVLATGEATGGPLPDVLVVVEATRVFVACAARAHVTSATEISVSSVSPGCPAPSTVHAFALPAALPAVPQPIDALVEAFGSLALPTGTSTAIATTEAAPMHLLTRVLRSMARASLTPTLFALAAPDGTLGTSPLVLATSADTPPITVHIRLGGFAVARAHGRDGTIPRIRGTSGLEPDHAGLAAMARAEASGAAVALDAMGTVPAAELIRATRVLASSGARVTLALP